jgi:hypothetical protein
MPADYRYSGTVPLKPDADPEVILQTYERNVGEVLDPGMPGSFRTEYGEVIISFEGDEFGYEVDGTFSGGFGSDFEDFLKEVSAKHAAAAWVDYGPDDTTTIYGPTAALRCAALIKLRFDELQHAQSRYDDAIILSTKHEAPAAD